MQSYHASPPYSPHPPGALASPPPAHHQAWRTSSTPHPQDFGMTMQPMPQSQLPMQYAPGPPYSPPMAHAYAPQHPAPHAVHAYNTDVGIPHEHLPWVMIGWLHHYSTSTPVYGPPGAKFDGLGNVYIHHPGNRKEYVTPYRGRGSAGVYDENDEWCGLARVFCYAPPKDWQSTRYVVPPELRGQYING